MIDNTLKKQLKESLFSFFNVQKKEWKGSPFVMALDDLCNIVAEGKLLRGSLFLETVSQGKKHIPDIKTYIKIAMAIEITHMAFLVHDDIMDNSTQRRGKPTIHELWKKRSVSHQDNHHYGYSQAICIGDIGLFLAQQLLLEGSFLLKKPEIALLAQKEWIQVCFGQMLDMDLSVGSFNLETPDETILELYRTKTAQYTFSVPLTMAGQCLELRKDQQNLLYSVGQDLGILFQIQDDYLDIFGEAQTVKKSLGQDIREKKKTLYLSKLYKVLPVEDQDYFLKLSQSLEPLTNQEVEWLKKQIKEYGIDLEIETIIARYLESIGLKIKKLEKYPWIVKLIEDILLDSSTRKY